MKIDTAKSALQQSNLEQAGCTVPLMENSAESRPNALATVHEPRQRDYFTQWWNEYQRKMRVRFQPELLKRKGKINQDDFQESCPVSPSVAPYGTSNPAERATESRSSCEQPYRTAATRMVLAAWLPLIFHARTVIAPRQVDGPRASQAAGAFQSCNSAQSGDLQSQGSRTASGCSSHHAREWNQRCMDVSLIAKNLIFEFNES